VAELNIPAAPPIEGTTHLHSGKVRDLYRIDSGEHEGRLLMVASDRISAYDFVLETPIPDKGEILTRMSLWWFDQLSGLVQNHVISTDVPDSVRGRAVVCERLDMYPVECVARGYLTGSVLGDYQTFGEVCGIALPAGLQDGSRLSEPIFTPATKATLGDHDVNVDFESVAEKVGDDAAAELRMLTLAIYGKAEEIAREQGIILADTKFEFGRRDDYTTVLGDEVLTPDSSRFWPAADWQPGRTQASYDKQFLRNWLLSPESGWDRASGELPPPLPEEIVGARGRGTSRRTNASPASPGDRRNVTRGGYDMGSFTITLDLPQPPAVLFRYLADPRNRPEWQSSLRSVTDIDPGEPHAGMQWRDITKVGIKPHMQLTELIPYRTLSEIGTWHGIDGLLTLKFLKVGDGTRLTAEGRVIGRGPFAGAAAVAGRFAPATIKADLERAGTVLGESS